MDSSDFFGTSGAEAEEVVDEEWYEKNLQLAAELGKALLEKNRELEAQLVREQTTREEQAMEIQYLKSQLDTMRTMTESRNRVYEEVDRTAQDLERSNQRLMMDAKADRGKIEKQSLLIGQLEEKMDTLEVKLEEVKAKEKKANKNNKKPEQRRTASLNRLSVADTKGQSGGFYFDNLKWTQTDQFKNIPLNPYEFEIRKLQDGMGALKVQQTIDRRKMEDLDVECSVLLDEKALLEHKVKVLETKLSEAIMIQYELERRRPTVVTRVVHDGGDAGHGGGGGGVLTSSTDIHDEIHEPESRLMGEIEHDDPELRSEAKAVKLETGGSLYSSTESINKVATDAKEIHIDDASLSILDELESQYQSLFTKYNSLIQNKSKKSLSEDPDPSQRHKEVQTLLHITLQRDYYQDAAHTPPYKALFKDIFATLRKNKIEENADAEAEREKRLSGVYTQTGDATPPVIDGR